MDQSIIDVQSGGRGKIIMIYLLIVKLFFVRKTIADYIHDFLLEAVRE